MARLVVRTLDLDAALASGRKLAAALTGVRAWHGRPG